jgi:Zn-finger nucleic acid-binding protein
MKCLRCASVELETHTQGTGPDEIEVDQCPSCGGMWLDSDELKHLDDSLTIDLEQIPYTSVTPTSDDGALQCPRCEGAPTLRKAYPASYPDVVVDTCRECKGFWLDKDEIKKMREVSDRLLLKSLDEDEE